MAVKKKKGGAGGARLFQPRVRLIWSKRTGLSQSGQEVGRQENYGFIRSHPESNRVLCDDPILALGGLFSWTYQLTGLKKHSMPKQFRLKITLWAIFFFRLLIHRKHVNKIFAPWAFSPLLPPPWTYLFDTIRQVAGLESDIQNSKPMMMELSFRTAKCPEKNRRIKEPSIHRQDNLKIDSPSSSSLINYTILWP